MDECHNGYSVPIHSIHHPVVSDEELPIDATFIFWNLPAGFGELPYLLNALLNVQSEGVSVTGGIRFNEGHQRLEVVARNR